MCCNHYVDVVLCRIWLFGGLIFMFCREKYKIVVFTYEMSMYYAAIHEKVFLL